VGCYLNKTVITKLKIPL